MNKLVLVLALSVLPSAAGAQPALWNTLHKELPGTWTAEAGSGKTITVTVEAVSGGTVLAERFGTGPRASLTTYHPDGEQVLLTHYCPQGNQPRLRASKVANNTVTFSFQDVTNKKPGQAMLTKLVYVFGEDGTLTRSETYRGANGKDDVTTLVFTPSSRSR